MSNASNLSTLANVLDDGSDGQFLKSTGSGGVAFDTVAAGATVYSSASDLPLTGNTVGDMAYVSAATTAKVVNQTTGSVSTEDATRLYIYSGTGWYSVAFITQNPTINTVQDAGGGSTPFTLATDGTTATVVTITANDPESVPLTYSYGITNGALNGCTITGADGTSARVAGTAYTDNVFTVTPHASNDATFTITFTASDGINQATSANAFSLSFSSWSNAAQQAKIQASDAGYTDRFGNDVSISSDGNTAIVGAYLEDTTASDAGSAYIFTRSGSTWSQQAKIQASDAEASDNFGQAVSISGDGNTAIVGAYFEDTTATGAGSVYIFTRSGSTWSQQAKIQASDAQSQDRFGNNVSISSDGNTAIIGAYYEDTTASGAGSAYIFTRSGSTWSQQAKIQASDAGANDNFGIDVSISSDGNTAIIGAYLEDTGASGAGSAYIFTRSGTTWSQEAKIQASDPEGNDYFGRVVSISSDGDTAIVGASNEDTTASGAGSVYIFTRSGSTWSQEAKIQASDAGDSDKFGNDVSISSDGNIAIVGANLEDTTASDAGSVYIFTRSGSTWSQQAKIQASDAGANDNFGEAVSISSDGDTAIVGSWREDTTTTDAGSAYIFVPA